MIDTIPADLPPAAGQPAPAGSPTEAAPSRRCIATGRVLPRERLVRFVASPDGTVMPDLEAKLPGRGLWVAAERAALQRAMAKGLFRRAAGEAVTVPEDLPARTIALLERRCLAVIGMARRAGLAVAGFIAVRGWLDEGRAAVLLAASDAGPNGRAKLERQGVAQGLPLVDRFAAAALGQALGREMAVHAALGTGGLARLFLTELDRLRGLEGQPGPAALN